MADNYEYYDEEAANAPAAPGSPAASAHPSAAAASPKASGSGQPAQPAAGGQDYDYYYDENNPAPSAQRDGGSPALSPKASPITQPPTAAASPTMLPKTSPTVQPPTAAASPTMLPKGSAATPAGAASPTMLPKGSPAAIQSPAAAASPVASPHSLSQAGKNTAVLYLFDVDGTLTPLKGNISHDMMDFVNKVSQKVCVGLISGSDMKKLSEQMSGMEKSLDHVFAENGTVYCKKGVEVFKTSIYDLLGADKMTKFMDYVLEYISKLVLPVKKGNFVELRNNMINISPIGRATTQPERDQFVAKDKEDKIRKNFVKALNTKFADYGFIYNIAGEISFDVYPKGWDKSYCLENLEKEKFQTVHFFGDKVDKGENDYEIFHDKRVIGHRVSGPEDTKKQVSELLHL